MSVIKKIDILVLKFDIQLSLIAFYSGYQKKLNPRLLNSK